MKKAAGFNLVELMVALAMSSLIISLISTSYAWLYAGFVYNRNQLSLNQNLRFSLRILKQDLQNAGVFGSFSFHNQSARSAYDFNAATLSHCSLTNDWCFFESATVGVKSYFGAAGVPLNVIPAGASLDSSSDVLRIQYGGSNVAYFNQRDGIACSTSHSCTINQCITDANYYLGRANFTAAAVAAATAAAFDGGQRLYFLASSNHGYLLSFSVPPLVSQTGGWLLDMQLAASNGCPIPGNARILIESGFSAAPDYNYISNDPDMTSLQLVNFYTRYYFVATIAGIKGLYVETSQSNGQLSEASLVSARVNQMNFSYKLDSSNSYLNRYPNTANRHSWCSGAAMNGMSSSGRSNTNCQGKWASISAVMIGLAGVSKETINLNGQKINQFESDSVGWLW